MIDHRKMKRAVTESGKTQFQVSQEAEIPEGYMSVLCNHDTNIQTRTLIRLCEATGASADDLLLWSNND